MVRMINVSAVRDTGLCMGCGTCESICATGAIEVRLDDSRGIYRPIIESDLCKKCGLCLSLCPGVSVNIGELAGKFLDGHTRDTMLGTFDACYVGHASCQDIRYNSASGGLVTSLLIYAIDTGLIDGALVLRMSQSSPLEAEPYIASTRSQIISASGSKYCPAPVNKLLRSLLSQKGRYAVVGLPCHIHAIRKLQATNVETRKKITLLLGLFCANNNTYLATEYFLRNNGIDPQDVKRIRYRDEGWPGKISVNLLDNTKRIMPRGTTEKNWYRRVLFSSAFHYDFAIPRCLLCVDQTCELADISFGDPWLREYKQSERLGKSLVIVRNRLGRELLIQAKEAGVVALEDIPIGSVKKAQNYAFKAGVGARIRLARFLRFALPDYGKRHLNYKASDFISAFRYLPSYISYHRCLWPFIRVLAIVYYLKQMAFHRFRALLAFFLKISRLKTIRMYTRKRKAILE